MSVARRALLVGPIVAPRDRAATREFVRGLRLAARDRVIAVDGGFDVCRKLGLAPALAVGDWDSLRGGERALPPPSPASGLILRTLPREKDRSDLYHAARAADARELIGIGLLGGARPDHELANLLELSALVVGRGPCAGARLWAPGSEWHCVGPRAAWGARVARGQVISVFALGGTARGVRVAGLKYDLENQSLAPSSRGLSNEGLGKRCRVDVRSGALAIYLAHVDR